MSKPLKFRKGPEVVDAWQFEFADGAGIPATPFMPDWLREARSPLDEREPAAEYLPPTTPGEWGVFSIATLDGVLRAEYGSWIVRDAAGALAVYSDADFTRTYELAEP